METPQALQTLGLNSEASAAEITKAYQSKKQQLLAMMEKAPSDALKQKYAQSIEQLEVAYQVLSSADSGASDSKPSQLSQSKFDDLPFAKPRHSQFEEQAQAEVNIQEGQVLAGRYKIEEKIAAGGMGVVYRAFDQNRNEDIAIKVMLPSLVKNARARERFMDEARLSSKLSHPNIVNVYDVQNEGDLYFLTMELLEGQDLRDVMESRKATAQPFTKDEVQDLLSQITQGLNHAHQTTVHRDLKPENIYLTEEGDYKVMDFGIARVQSASQRTQSGAVSGTAYYMAPEQVKGAKNIDARADQYAMAVFTYELLTGEVPTGMITPLHELRPDVGKGFSKALERALANNPEHRFASLDEFLQALKKGKAGKSRRTSSSATGDGFNWSKLAPVAVIVVGLLMGVGIWQSGLVDVSKLFVSKEEIAAQKAEIAQLQGEIKNFQRRLDNGRRDLKSEVRDAERNNSKDLKALAHWQRLTDDYIFDGSVLTDLEGQLSMGESLLREESLEQAKLTMTEVRDGYKGLWDEFTAAEKLHSAQAQADVAKANWFKRKKAYGVSAEELENAAQQQHEQAEQVQRVGEFVAAQARWQSAQAAWEEAFASQANTVAGIAERKAKAKAEAVSKLALEQKYLGRLVEVPAGSFQMGCVSGLDCSNHEKPVHRVTLKAFRVMEHEVTWKQYDLCMNAGACPDNQDDGGDHGWGAGSRPVIIVSYNDIVNHYIPWLKKMTGQDYRLPSEAEWEYAARAGSRTKYSWGNRISCSQARYGQLNGDCGNDLKTVPVKSYQANAWGLYDMHGNVREWTADCWNDTYHGAPTNGGAWAGGDCSMRVLRGGSWGNAPLWLRSASRVSGTASVRALYGFRLVQDL